VKSAAIFFSSKRSVELYLDIGSGSRAEDLCQILSFQKDSSSGESGMRKIPSTMSTQHPDNANPPPWIDEQMIREETEVREAYLAYRELECEEQMWDWEGKDVDPNVVRKLVTDHQEFFKEHVLGRDIFLTYRIPNLSAERVERKVLLEALESIPRCYDTAKFERFNEG